MKVARADKLAKLASTAIPMKVALADKIALSIPEAKELSGVGRSSIYEALKSGNLPGKKLGKSTLILRDDLIRWMQALPSYAEASVPAPRRRAKDVPQ
jgi:excisionase family DNA binding protein